MLDEEKLNELVEMIKESLREKLKREPTEEEVAEKLPVFLCDTNEEE